MQSSQFKWTVTRPGLEAGSQSETQFQSLRDVVPIPLLVLFAFAQAKGRSPSDPAGFTRNLLGGQSHRV